MLDYRYHIMDPSNSIYMLVISFRFPEALPDLIAYQLLIVKPFTTNDDYSRHRNSAACYQLAQSVLKIVESVGQGEVGGSTALADRAWRLLQLAIEKGWSAARSSAFLYKQA